MKQIQATTAAVMSIGFLAVLLAASKDANAAYVILVAAVVHTAEELWAWKNKRDEFSNRLGSMGALVAFGVAPSLFVLDTLLALNAFLLVLPLLYLIAAAISLTRYDLTRRLAGLPVTVNGFVLPALYLTGIYDAFVVAGWMLLASALMAFDISFRRSRQPEYEVRNAEEKKSAPEGFVPLSEW
ncbi:MAG: hypothetical protein HYS81_04985 [Candidatus Aenigmatarchaeota archaeon]|nr:MAG: hypothetical protein HYS81_04985 [Candidatus Aenigmarchaeota archaeon]